MSVINHEHKLLSKNLEQTVLIHSFFLIFIAADMTVVGFMTGLPQHYFYSIMDVKLPGKNVKTVFKKILLDQIIASPACITIFFLGLGILEHGSLSAGYEELKRKCISVYVVINFVIFS